MDSQGCILYINVCYTWYITVLFLTIQFSISHFFVLTLIVKQFYLTHIQDPFKCYHSEPEWTWARWQWRSTPYSPNVQHYWSPTIRLFNVKSRTLIRGVLPLCWHAVGVFYNPSWLSNILFTYITFSTSLNYIWWEGSNSGTPRSTLIWRDSTS